MENISMKTRKRKCPCHI
jgi:hypothetical protein